MQEVPCLWTTQACPVLCHVLPLLMCVTDVMGADRRQAPLVSSQIGLHLQLISTLVKHQLLST
jgi:hypothetical protein